MWRSRKSAFTLIELLVVIAVIAILAAFLFPVFAQAREKARATGCVSNLRQVAMAIHQYMQDWEGGLPEFWEWGTTPERYVSLRWYSHLEPYLKSRELLHCPADPVTNGRRALPWRQPYLSWADYPIVPRLSYGYNYWLQENNEGLVRRPAETVLVGDCAGLQCADARRTIGGNDTSCYAFANGMQAVDEFAPLTGRPGQERHRGGSNMVFFDGHVRFMASGQFRKRWENRTCFEHPLVNPRCEPW